MQFKILVYFNLLFFITKHIPTREISFIKHFWDIIYNNLFILLDRNFIWTATLTKNDFFVHIWNSK